MTPRALFPLLARPKGLAVAAIATITFSAPLMLVMHVGSTGLDRATVAMVYAVIPSLVVGFACGGAIAEAMASSFAWLVPHYRRRLRFEFTIVGLGLAALVGLVVTAALGTGAGAFFPVCIASLAAWSAGAALATVPEGRLVLPLLFVVPLAGARWGMPFDWAAQTPLAVVTLATGLAIGAIAAAFGPRTFRWASLTATRNPLGGFGGGPKLEYWRTLPWWPARAPAAPRVRPGLDVRSLYAITVARRVAQVFRAQGPLALAHLLVSGVLLAAVYVVVLQLAGGATHDASLERFCAVFLAMGFVQPRQFDRSGLPWSRRDHLVITWGWHLALLLLYALVAWPSFLLLTRHSAPPGMSFFAGAVLVASAAVIMPAASWALGDLLGSSRPYTAKRFLIGVPTIMWGSIALDALLRWLLPTTTAQVVVLALLLIASQALHRHALKRFFERRDLVRESP